MREVSALGSRKCWGGGGPVGQRGGRRRRHGWMVTVYCPSWSPYTHTRLSWTLYTLPLDQHIHKLLGHHLMSEQKYMHPLHRYNIIYIYYVFKMVSWSHLERPPHHMIILPAGPQRHHIFRCFRGKKIYGLQGQ